MTQVCRATGHHRLCTAARQDVRYGATAEGLWRTWRGSNSFNLTRRAEATSVPPTTQSQLPLFFQFLRLALALESIVFFLIRNGPNQNRNRYRADVHD